VILKRFGEAEGGETTPELPSFVWHSLTNLETLADFIGDGKAYTAQFETPLDDASKQLRSELASIFGDNSSDKGYRQIL